VFVGKLTKDVEPPLIADGDINNQSLIYNTFLATPLLLFGKPGYKEDKWSGTNCKEHYLNLAYSRARNRDVLGDPQ
jgi:hypothetical protein